MDKISLELNREETETLLRFLSLVIINLQINPESYGFKATELKLIHEKMDYLVHEVAHWCDKPDCSYWVKKKAKNKERKNMN